MQGVFLNYFLLRYSKGTAAPCLELAQSRSNGSFAWISKPGVRKSCILLEEKEKGIARRKIRIRLFSPYMEAPLNYVISVQRRLCQSGVSVHLKRSTLHSTVPGYQLLGFGKETSLRSYAIDAAQHSSKYTVGQAGKDSAESY
ncbi:Hypothetical predicted protein [Podarcis lilfordi]|uniref:Uncharacterized protein n=1 Tax=Podarcis lilfordi TaxID=74358 RepID=A0AA35PLF5_9SAUR|nr:Hypothetical predicted protein [Podarcis lilfordi]